MKHNLDAPSPALTQQLLLSMVEQMKLSLVHIARQTELTAISPSGSEGLDSIRVMADATLQLLDNYALGVRLAGQTTLQFEIQPISVAATLYDTGNQLQSFAKAYGVDLSLQIDGRYGPVMAHREGLQAAFVSLGHALIEALPAHETQTMKLNLSAHRCRYGIVAGLYYETTEAVTVRALRLGRELYGRARQPLNSLSPTSGTGVFVADAILHAMQSQLTTSRHRHLYGLGAVLPLSAQLRLV